MKQKILNLIKRNKNKNKTRMYFIVPKSMKDEIVIPNYKIISVKEKSRETIITLETDKL